MVFRGEEIKKALERRVDYIGIDIDGGNVTKLLRVYFAAKKLFPKSKIEVYVSSSKAGFHIIIWKKVSVLENFYWRAMLGDDNIRISLNLKKLFANPSENYNDVLFQLKKGKRRIKIDIEKILKKHKEDVEKYVEKRRWEDLIRLADMIRGEIPLVRKWITCIPFNEKDFLNVEAFCENSGLEYSIFQSYYPDSDYLLVVFSESVKKAKRVGKFFESRLGLSYWIKLVY